jgi:photosystem II stability/assembly factor-like uncharacterized protein
VGSGLINTYIWALAFGRPGTIFAAGRAVYRSRDDGATWSKVLDLAVPFRVLAVDRSEPETVYAGTLYPYGPSPHIAWKSTDGGDTWTPLPYPQPAASPLVALHAMDLVSLPSRPEVVLLATQLANAGADDPAVVYRSADGGQTWAPLSFPPGGSEFVSLAVHPGRPETAWALCPFGLYKSTDGGLTWSLALSGRPLEILVSVAVAPSDGDVVWVESSGSNYRSTDGGASWARMAALPGYSYATSPRQIAIDPANPLAAYETRVFGSIFRKVPGLPWQEFVDGLFNPSTTAIAFDPADPGRLLVGTSGGGVFEVHVAP